VTPSPGVTVTPSGVHFAVVSRDAEQVSLCLFEGERETRLPMSREEDLHNLFVPGARSGQAYGYRACGPRVPEKALLFDNSKLLVDPYALALDRPFVFDLRLSERGYDTGALIPKSIVCDPSDLPLEPPRFRAGGLIYELNIRGFSMRHPDVPPALRGTIAALAHPAIISHLTKLKVDAVELMPIVAWIDERHLPPLGLHNAWGYNPVVPMALDPRLAPGGIAELRGTVEALHGAGIGVILDLVLNHTGESDVLGPTLSMRGLDDRYYARDANGELVNYTGTGNMMDAGQAVVRNLMLDTLRHFVRHCGVDGFRLDLATVMARGPDFDPTAPIFSAISADPLLSDRILIAEPWDPGPGGYQLGRFPSDWLEWNDRYRDDARRFWRGDASTAAVMATRLMGSSDLFSGKISRSVNFLASHDGFTLADLVAYRERHNQANGENNRDGHAENHSWNYGVEGPSDDPILLEKRGGAVRSLLTTLFASRGAIMLTAGDEFGRTQKGNNNAYAQDSEITWLDWQKRDRALEEFVARLSVFRNSHRAALGPAFLHQADWRDLDGEPMTQAKWEDPAIDGFLVTVCDGLTIRIDRRQHIAEMRNGGGTLIGTIRHQPG
jgi:glycogen operon protein